MIWVFQAVVDGWSRAAALCCCLHSVSTWSGVRWSIAEWRRLRSHRDPVRAVASRIAWSRAERTPRFTSSLPETALNDSAAALSQRLPVRPADGRTPRPVMNPVHPAGVHRAPRSGWRTVTPRIGGRARRGHGLGDESGAHATGDRAPDDPFPGEQSMTTAGWADPRRAGACAVPPTRLIPGAVAAKPRGSRPGRSGRSGAGTIRPGPSPGGRRATGPAAATIADHAEREASTPPRAGPARTRRQPQVCSDPSKNPTTTAAGSSPRRVVEDPGRFRRAQQPDSDASTHRRTDRTGRSPSSRWMRRCPALTRTPGRRRPPLLPGTRSPCGPPGALPSDV